MSFNFLSHCCARLLIPSTSGAEIRVSPDQREKLVALGTMTTESSKRRGLQNPEGGSQLPAVDGSPEDVRNRQEILKEAQNVNHRISRPDPTVVLD